jgi:leader peptidase (prepilin peptidase)/N-methyltransferase
LDPLTATAIFLIGLALGSFLNVCISRIPQDQSVISPRSACPHCGAAISWRDNIPIVSWLLLRGRCRACRVRISLRYPAVELLIAALFVASYAVFGASGTALKSAVFCFLAVGLIFMDAETGLLLAEFTYSGILLGLLFALLVPFDAPASRFPGFIFGAHAVPLARAQSLIAAGFATLLGATFFYLVWAFYYLLKKTDGSGFGDIAMAAMLGAFLGLKGLIAAVVLAYLLGTAYALALLLAMLVRRTTESPAKQPLGATVRSLGQRAAPFGVFLGIAGVAVLFWGESLWTWYLGLIG